MLLADREFSLRLATACVTSFSLSCFCFASGLEHPSRYLRTSPPFLRAHPLVSLVVFIVEIKASHSYAFNLLCGYTGSSRSRVASRRTVFRPSLFRSEENGMRKDSVINEEMVVRSAIPRCEFGKRSWGDRMCNEALPSRITIGQLHSCARDTWLGEFSFSFNSFQSKFFNGEISKRLISVLF